MHQGDGRMKYIGVLGLQGGVEEHHHLLAQLPEVKSIDVKYISQLEEIDGLIIPGGESTTLGRLLRVFNMLEPTKHLEVMDITVRRNAYGRQLGSFETMQQVNAVEKAIPLVFIRAPLVSKVGEQVEILEEVRGEIVACKEKNMLATSFHPELTTDTSFHHYFVKDLC